MFVLKYEPQRSDLRDTEVLMSVTGMIHTDAARQDIRHVTVGPKKSAITNHISFHPSTYWD